MNRSHLIHLVCPKCQKNLELIPAKKVGDRVKKGGLKCRNCSQSYPITNFIPRFVSEQNTYAVSFGYQWNKHSRTQFDKYSAVPISEERFFKETRWSKNLKGEILLEAGSGSGRFTEHAASTGAMTISFDYSNAVDANYKNNGHLENVLFVQASIYEMPFKKNYFDKIFCIGVIQHTPNPEKAFLCLSEMLKSKGNIVIDVYRKLPWWIRIFETKYWVRPITKKIPSLVLYRFCERWVNFWWGITALAVKLTGRRFLSWSLLIADYRGVYPLSDKVQKEWSILDSFDMLSPQYDFPQTIASVRSWFEKAELVQVEVNYGYNGIEGRGFKR
ncbi:MAG: methyltransferase domain-containing protein [Candidatus Hodarchaeota archaeon]